ncbi:MAG: hypothetical protein A3A58_03675 [Candidatus Blackburnbacteria bacterium RIFCSPLOWO2_01_FULL_41_27]|uniref:HTH cro/C1-type domain-containing protein n=2 Tax=Candidatus Blackburniibacteriota TaxID=1817898 RepID=A0A1G1V5H2_9BACT|nr:MAG: hypothetical protein A3F61_01180 [Candidatus Blackburnbacteria bacterium RIFCSPHIGHO2_12_FULL_41_13b]OGY13927.1 MAG: hypothetical protein A3A58_03675 [Candidatus Blackburnbacteria bacterium RIFCSPLOWO2_01_FULL_41_27]
MSRKKLTIFDNIKEARINVRISQKELARKLNLSDKTVSAYETGRAIPPSPTLLQIAQITQTSITKLLGITDEHTDQSKLWSRLDEIIEKLTSVDKELKKINKTNKLT